MVFLGKKIKEVVSEISSRYKYVSGAKGKKEKIYQEIKQTKPKDKKGKMLRFTKLAAIDIEWFLFCLMKFGIKDADKIFLNNEYITKWEEKNKDVVFKDTDSRFKQFFKDLKKEHPLAAARLKLWMIYSLFTLATIWGAKITEHDDVDDLKKFLIEKIQEKKDAHEQEKNVVKEIDALKIDPNLSDEEWKKQIDLIWPYLYMEIILSEGFIDEAYADVGDSGGYLTIGSGYMIGKANPAGDLDRAIIKERKRFFKKALGKSYVNGVKISYEENRILIYEYCKTYVWPYMKKSFKTPMDTHLFIELCIGNFNRGSGIYQSGQKGEEIRKAVNSGKSIKQIVNKFDDFHTSGNDGLLPKYGVAAHRALGNITDEDVLNSLANSVYKLEKGDFWKNGVLIENDTIAQKLMKISSANVYKNGKTYVQRKVREYMTDVEIEKISQGKLFVNSSENRKKVQEKEETPAEKLNKQAEDLFADGKYNDALEKFNEAIKLNPKLYIVYSNLSLVYYKLGEYEKGLSVLVNLVNTGLFNDIPSNIKGYMYYNAALCLEKLGDNAEKNENKQKYYNRAVKCIELGERVANTQYSGFDKRIKRKVSDIKKANKTNENTKKVTFNKGIQKMKNKENYSNNYMRFSINHRKIV